MLNPLSQDTFKTNSMQTKRYKQGNEKKTPPPAINLDNKGERERIEKLHNGPGKIEGKAVSRGETHAR
ncbi:hypothetical protein OUZ56_000618 [Daphnia magna]|uniref:Uncharacterized protein n=1 Tax=Daphnia magna TaxID=35525 RepID=A0ABR0A081_9CRUS|nr:hypothetical protein OUZ56_000618 [Daphnia magna]